MTLLAPLFLLGLLALVVPWWLHLISTDDPPQQEFGSSMFLEQQQTVSSKQSRLRYWLLLLLRTLAVVLLALLFAEPVLEKLNILGDESTRHVVVVDTSLSQSHEQRWQRTQLLAGDILSGIPASDQILMVGAGGSIEVDENNDYSATTATAQLAALSPDSRRLEYSSVTRAINGLVRESPLPVEVHFVSDLQQSAMPERFADLAITGIEQLTLHSTASADDSNVSVTAVVNESADNVTDLSVLVHNHSAQTVSREVNVASATAVLQSKTIELAADTRTLIPFDALDTGDADGSLTITLTPGDALTLDDSFTLAIPDGNRSEVAVIGGLRDSLASTYVTAAIESDPRYSANLITGDAVSATEVGPMVIVPDASTLSDRGSSNLQKYIDTGGSALVIVGSQPHSTNMRSLLNIASKAPGSDTPRRITTADASQPLVKDVAGDWRALSVQQLLNISTSAADRIVLSTDNRTALLVERNVGSGRLLVFSSALDPLWNNLALEPLFVPFIIRSVEYLRGDSAATRNLAIGDMVSLAPGAQLLNRDGASLRDLAELTRRGSFTFTEPGVYTVKSTAGNSYLSVNTDPQESQLGTLDNAQIERWQSLGSASNVEATTAASAASNTSQQSLWYWLLLGLLAVALIESLYSHRHLWVKRGA
ncbi:MAG: BatA domain-containing protein [Pseudomonadota bacterium]